MDAERQFENATKTADKLNTLSEEIQKSDTVTDSLIASTKEILSEKDIQTNTDNTVALTNFAQTSNKGSKITQKNSDAILAELNQLQLYYAKEKIRYGDLSRAELECKQVLLLKQTWEVIKESCITAQDAKMKVDTIDERLSRMEKTCEVIENYIDAYNSGEHGEEHKKILLEQINEDYGDLHCDYIITRREINKLKPKIANQIIKLDNENSLQTQAVVQSILLIAVDTIQTFMGKGSIQQKTLKTAAGISSSANQMSKNLAAKKSIAEVKQVLVDLLKQVAELEQRLERVKEIKEKAKQFLLANGIEVVEEEYGSDDD